MQWTVDCHCWHHGACGRHHGWTAVARCLCGCCCCCCCYSCCPGPEDAWFEVGERRRDGKGRERGEMFKRARVNEVHVSVTKHTLADKSEVCTNARTHCSPYIYIYIYICIWILFVQSKKVKKGTRIKDLYQHIRGGREHRQVFDLVFRVCCSYLSSLESLRAPPIPPPLHK